MNIKNKNIVDWSEVKVIMRYTMNKSAQPLYGVLHGPRTFVWPEIQKEVRMPVMEGTSREK